MWFQNRRAKWKKRKKTTNVFRSPGALIPSTCLSPFGGINDAFFNFPSSDPSRGWSSMTGMGQMGPPHMPVGGPGNHFVPPPPPPPSLSRQSGLGQPFSHSQMTPLAGLTNPHHPHHQGIPHPAMGGHHVGAPPPPTSAGMYSPSGATVSGVVGSYCDSPMSAQMTYGLQEMDDSWRGTSIASLRRKALEHTVSMTGMATYR